MSVYKNNIQAFIDVIESKFELFLTQDWVELNKLASNVLDDDQEIADTIENWLASESRSQILQAYEERLEALDCSSNLNLNGNLGPGNIKFPTPPNQPSDSAKELLENAIKKNSPVSDSPPTQPKQP